jgi:hemolysin activation/secretion protein
MVRLRYGSLIAALVFCVSAALSLPLPSFAAESGEEDSHQAEEVEKMLSQKRPKSPAVVITERVESAIPRLPVTEGKTKITQVDVYGSTILADSAIAKLKRRYVNRELTSREIQGAADLVNRAYRREGYITSYAYVNPDKLGAGILEIQVKEGRVGKITIQGNKNFSESVLRKKVTLQEGDLLNFKKLNQDLFVINKHQDRKADLKIEPNIGTGISDIVITVKDRNPFHVTLQADNYGSEYIGYRRYKTYFLHNNLTGHDDSLQFKVQMAEMNAHKLYDLDYYYPLNNDWKFNFYLMPYKKEDYVSGDNPTNDFEKHAWKWYFWFKNYLVNKPDCEFISSYGFVFKQINWYQYGNHQASDHFRALEWELDLNRQDPYGRWVVSNLVEIGLPHFMGGADTKEDDCSVQSAGGAYKRNKLIVARRQKLWNGIDFLTKGNWQISSMTLTGVNVFSVGGTMGVIDDRGYPRAQLAGDSGRSLSAGFSIPPFGLSRTARVPGSKTTWYDDIRVFPFMDYAVGVLKSPKDGDDKVNTLTSAGIGVVFNVPDNAFSTRVDVAWPVTKEKPKDGDSPHIWWSVTKGF